MSARAHGIDHLRAFVVVSVVFHHAALAYASFAWLDPLHYLQSTAPVVDPRRWSALDAAIAFNDGYFMPLLFLLSGLFAWPALQRRGPRAYARRRGVRLGLSFAFAAGLLMPLAHYAALLARGEAAGFGNYLWRSLRDGPWPSGPLWFVWLLLAFDLALAMVAQFPGAAACAGRIGRCVAHAGRSWVALACVSAAACLPLLLACGGQYWFALGPFAVQASRVGLYAAYFAFGCVLGAAGATEQHAGWQGALGRRWLTWSIATLAAFALLQWISARYGTAMPDAGAWRRIAYGVALVVFAATAAHGAIALAWRFARRPSVAWDGLAANGYGIYLLHYVPVLWLQYALLGAAWPVAAKVALVFGGSLASAWLASAAARRALRQPMRLRQRTATSPS